jgi:predicted Zn-dependent protease
VGNLIDMLDSPQPKQRSSAVYAMGEIGESLKRLSNVPHYLLLISALREDLERRREEVVSREAVAVPAELRKPPARAGAPPAASPTPKPPAALPADAIEEVLAALGAGRLDQAVAKLQESLGAHPQNPYLLFLAADIDRRRSELGAACEGFDRLHAVDPSFVNSHLHLANLYSRSQEIPQSLAEYFAALKSQVSIFESQIELGLTLLREKKINEAALLLKGLMGQVPIDAQLHLKAGKEFLRNRLPAQAFGHLARAYLLAPTSAEEIFRLALCCMELGQLAQARVLARKLGSLFADDPEAHSRALKLLELIAQRDQG